MKRVEDMTFLELYYMKHCMYHTDCEKCKCRATCEETPTQDFNREYNKKYNELINKKYSELRKDV